jgi:hypothetical protein
MTSPQNTARPAPDAISIDFERAAWPTLLLSIGLIAGFGYLGVYMVTAPQYPAVGWFLIAGMGLWLLLLLTNIRKLFQPRGLTVSPAGLRYHTGGSADLVPWPEIHVVVISRLEDQMRKAGVTLMKNSHRERLEIYPVDDSLYGQHPRLARFRKAAGSKPPGELWPAARWSIPLPPFIGARGDVVNALNVYSGGRYRGELVTVVKMR